jgi:hypothetical protein
MAVAEQVTRQCRSLRPIGVWHSTRSPSAARPIWPGLGMPGRPFPAGRDEPTPGAARAAPTSAPNLTPRSPPAGASSPARPAPVRPVRLQSGESGSSPVRPAARAPGGATRSGPPVSPELTGFCGHRGHLLIGAGATLLAAIAVALLLRRAGRVAPSHLRPVRQMPPGGLLGVRPGEDGAPGPERDRGPGRQLAAAEGADDDGRPRGIVLRPHVDHGVVPVVAVGHDVPV